jgi:hypothetical protein
VTPKEARELAKKIEADELRQKAKAVIEEESSLGQIARDVVLPAVQGATYNWADEAVGAGSAVLEKMKGSQRPFSELMEEGAAPMREAYKESVTRSPWISGVSEAVGGAISPGSKIGMGVKGIAKAAALGGFTSLGASENQKPIDAAKDVALGTALGGATTALTKGVSNLIPRDANVKRATVMGAGSRELQQVGIKDRAKIAQKLKDANFFKQGNFEFDPGGMKFKKILSVKPSKAEDYKIPVSVRMKDRAEQAVAKLQNEKENIWPAVSNKIVPDADIQDIMDKSARDYLKVNPDYEKALDVTSDYSQRLYNTLRLRAMEEASAKGVPYQGITLPHLDKLKSDISKYATYGKSLADTPDADVMYQSFARNIKDYVNDKVGNPNFKKYNDMQFNFLTALDDLEKKIAGIDSSQRRNIWDKAGVFLGDTFAGDDAGLGGALIRENLDKIPYGVRAITEGAIEEAPGAIFRQAQERGREPLDVGRSPNSVEEEPSALPFDASFMPTYVNEEILNTPLPRDSKRLLENQNAVMAKVRQFAPQALPMLEDAMRNDPEAIAKAGPMLAKLAPHVFERDEYEMFDGKITDPMMQSKFMADLGNDEALSSIEKAKIGLKISRGQPLY